MSGEGDQPGVVVAADTAEEAGRVATTLRAGGFHPTVDYKAIADRLGKFPVLVPAGEVGEAKGFLRGLRAAHALAPAVASTPALTASAPAQALPSLGSPAAGRALALLAGLLVLAGGAAVGLASMLQYFNSLRDH